MIRWSYAARGWKAPGRVAFYQNAVACVWLSVKIPCVWLRSYPAVFGYIFKLFSECAMEAKSTTAFRALEAESTTAFPAGPMEANFLN